MAFLLRISRTASLSLKPLLILSLLVFLLTLVSQARTHPHVTNDAFTGTHAFILPSSSDSRSPCPALNTLANHGYLPRDGKNITPSHLVHALKSAYGATTPLAWVLTYGGYFLLRNPPPPASLPSLSPSSLSLSLSSLSHLAHVAKSLPTLRKVLAPLDLSDLALHNHIEHDASLAHSNAPPHSLYAPVSTNHTLLDQLFAFATPNDTFTLSSIARARVLREYQSNHSIDPFHAEVARGEVALVLGIFGSALTDTGNINAGIDMPLFRTWFADNRLPAGWAPKHAQTLLGTVEISKAIRGVMERIGRGGVREAPGVHVVEKERDRPAPIIASPLANVSVSSSSTVSITSNVSAVSANPNLSKAEALFPLYAVDVQDKIVASIWGAGQLVE
ncbi:Cloroperoxidase [Neolentinus lepideus HHB14362 ss-1]|uniref:Cloroperoxidase n=1 Tax=Neolentinus lepideus HHB14362 ss-1 TaxID=1314782 RepID=A0A165NK03_9AGAM|nr:Cloroperoxidase [Neolentinus lepideus HHB14362 ss-1]